MLKLGQTDKYGNRVIKVARVYFWIECSVKFLKGLKCHVMNSDFSMLEGNWVLKLKIEDNMRDFK